MATREALLDAMLECLLEDGLTGLTTRRIAQRADVSQGTQQFYFPTRAQMLAGASERLAREVADQVRFELPRSAGTERFKIETFLDQLWRINNGPLFQAMIELATAARTDPEMRESLRAANRAVTKIIANTFTELCPDLAGTPGGREFLQTALAAQRGLAMFAPLALPSLEQRWQATREQLLTVYDTLPR